MLPCIIGRTSIIDVSSSGMDASINCALQLEFSSFKTFFFNLLTDPVSPHPNWCMQSFRLFHLWYLFVMQTDCRRHGMWLMPLLTATAKFQMHTHLPTAGGFLLVGTFPWFLLNLGLAFFPPSNHLGPTWFFMFRNRVKPCPNNLTFVIQLFYYSYSLTTWK